MSGHSKWAGIKHKKAVVDARRGQMFTKVTRELSVSAREGGPDGCTGAGNLVHQGEAFGSEFGRFDVADHRLIWAHFACFVRVL